MIYIATIIAIVVGILMSMSVGAGTATTHGIVHGTTLGTTHHIRGDGEVGMILGTIVHIIHGMVAIMADGDGVPVGMILGIIVQIITAIHVHTGIIV